LQRNQIAAVSALENKLSVRLSHLFAASALPCLKLEQITPFKNQVLKHPFIFIPNTLFTALLNCALTDSIRTGRVFGAARCRPLSF